jgi:hypothetical protein
MCAIVAASSNWWIGHLIDQLAYLGIEEQTAIIFVSDPRLPARRARLMGKMVPPGARRSDLDALAAP